LHFGIGNGLQMIVSRANKVTIAIGAFLLAPIVVLWAVRKAFIYFFILTLSGISIFYPNMYTTYKDGLKKMPYDVIIVPGVPYEGESWGNIMKIRVHWSNYLYNRGITKNIIYSGSSVYTPYIEAKVMALYGEALGVPKNHIFTEERAEHSTENVYYSYKMAKNLGFKKIALATDIFQTNNLRSFINDHDLEIELLPIVFDTLSKLNRYEPDIDPSSALVDTTKFIPLTERESFFKRFQGTLGKNIDWNEGDRPIN